MSEPTHEDTPRRRPRPEATARDLSVRDGRRLALAAGSLVFLLSLVVCWRTYRRSFGAGDPQALTAALIEAQADNLRVLEETGRALPASLEGIDFDQEVSLWRGPYPGIRYFLQGRAVHLDFWGRPLVYERRGDEFSIRSLGADGEPGGRGYDADLEDGEGIESNAAASFTDFLFEQPSRGLVMTAGLAGGLAYVTSCLLLRRRPSERSVRSRLVVNIVASVTITVLLAWLHIPIVSGH